MPGQPVPIHGPDHAADGPDPIGPAFNIYWASKFSNATTTVTTPWKVNGTIPQNNSAVFTNDLAGVYYENSVDEGGINTLRLLQDGLYFFRLEINVTFAEGGTHDVPPWIRAILMLKANTPASGFGDGGYTALVSVTHLTNGPAYLPDDDTDSLSGLSDTNVLEMVGHNWLRIRDLNTGTQNVPIETTWRIWSLGGTADWKYSARYDVHRMDEMLPNNSGAG